MFGEHTVDGRNPANQLSLVVYPIIYDEFLKYPMWLFGISEPSTVGIPTPEDHHLDSRRLSQLRGEKLNMVLKHLSNGMILQVGSPTRNIYLYYRDPHKTHQPTIKVQGIGSVSFLEGYIPRIYPLSEDAASHQGPRQNEEVPKTEKASKGAKEA